MDQEERTRRVQRYLIENKKFFPQARMNDIKSRLYGLSDQQYEQVEWLEFKDPTTMTLIAVFLGGFGADRFMLDDSKNGIMKILSMLACGIGIIWWLIDLFNITERTTEYNYKKFIESLSYV